MIFARFPHFFLPAAGLAMAGAGFACLMLCASDAQAAARNPRKTAQAADGNGKEPSARALRHYEKAWTHALKAERKGDFRRAAQALAKRDEGDALSTLYRETIRARMLMHAGDAAGADAALAAALDAPEAADMGWQRHLHRMRLQTSSVLSPPDRKEYLLTAVRAPLDNNARAEVLHALLALDSTLVPPAERAAYARQLVAAALPGARLEQAYRRWVAATDDAATRDAWGGAGEVDGLLLDAAEKLGLWDEAIARATAMAGRDTSVERVKSLRLKIAQYHYNKRSYGDAIEEYLAWRARYGETPGMLIQLARSYRALSQRTLSQTWYTRLVERFPRDARAAEVLWMRAFAADVAGEGPSADSALALYGRIVRDFPQHARAGDAMLRRGLVHYHRGEPAEAARAFSDLRLAHKSGRLTGAAHYWEGKALSAAGREEDARAAWRSMARDYPFGHYGHLARQELVARGALPDSLTWSRLLNDAHGEAVRAWFDARAPRVAPSDPVAAVAGDPVPGAPARGSDGPARLQSGNGESAWMPVERLFALGLDTLAVLTLQARANRTPDNLWLLYDAAVRCREAGFDYEAYRFGLRLSDKLPLAEWPSAPVNVLRVFYPPSYAELVTPASQRADIPPALVLALIKQESGFDPGAVSRAGARGLMQMMPATGIEQARREGLKDFDPDSLFVPAINIRLGVAYLRDVLKRHDGNIHYALAHYNAGPTALAHWIPRLQNRPPEEAVEDIGYAETRDYVKRVAANYKTYQVLWGEP